ncbi:MAG: ATP-binding cassette subfamily F protein 3 [Gammaproteobacteria bacterium]|jgi:ATP-binding cassette subfamily F protein 3
MIGLNEVSLQRGQKPLLEKANLLVHAGQRVGVIGANGTGKTSLFQLFLGQLQTDHGDVVLPKQLRITHMAQEVAHSDRTALDYVLDGDIELRETEAAIEAAQASENNIALAHGYDKLDTIDAHTAPSRAHQLLYGLGFEADGHQRVVNTFSGGWRIRLNLARALMCPSDLMLLDEPTNHLDLDATVWLEQYLLRYQGTLLLISHDRDFLDSVATHIARLHNQQINYYKGNYSAYEQQHAERMAQQQANYVKQQAERAHLQSYINRFKAQATKAKQAQSRIKALARMEDIAPAHIDSPFHFGFSEPPKPSNPLLYLEKATLGYDDKEILIDVDLSIAPGSRIGLLGPNGAGKSTLIKTLVGDLSLRDGTRQAGDNLRVGYFAQHQLEALDLTASPITHIQRLSPTVTEQVIRNFLGGFNFHGDMASEAPKHFSGGEKARLALAIVVWEKPNLLIMDEPTNHLDLEMCHALTMALQSFSGAMILVSHDRHLLRNSVDEFLLVADGQVETFDGDLDEYQQWLLKSKQGNSVSKIAANVDVPKVDKKEQRRLAAEQRKQLQPMKNKVSKVEAAIESNETELTSIKEQLLDTTLYEAANKDNLQEVLQRQGELKRLNEELEEEWMRLHEELEALKAVI